MPYVTGGEGPPLVLIHGWPQTWFEWRDIVPTLAEHRTVYAIDPPGLDDSEGSPRSFDKKTIAQYVDASLEDRLQSGGQRRRHHRQLAHETGHGGRLSRPHRADTRPSVGQPPGEGRDPRLRTLVARREPRRARPGGPGRHPRLTDNRRRQVNTRRGGAVLVEIGVERRSAGYAPPGGAQPVLTRTCIGVIWVHRERLNRVAGPLP
ncbi:hypothetical protein CI089_05060 [Microbacterium sp. Yaish 1]|nr:hypothetical protein CI089_05060 [Microbacterium sp. Yaish 1]